MTGTIRTFDPDMRTQILERVKRTAEQIAAASGATAEFDARRRLPGHVERSRADRAHDAVAQARRRRHVQPGRAADDHLRGFLVLRRRRSPRCISSWASPRRASDPAAWAANHSPKFSPDEAALITGVRALASVAVDYLAGGK